MRTKRTRPGRGSQRRPAVRALTLLAAAAVVSGCSTTQPASAPVAHAGRRFVRRDRRWPDTVLPSVVTISASNGTVTATGSGEVIRDSGEIMTNNHVIALAANGGPINVLFSDGTDRARHPHRPRPADRPRGDQGRRRQDLAGDRDGNVEHPSRSASRSSPSAHPSASPAR